MADRMRAAIAVALALGAMAAQAAPMADPFRPPREIEAAPGDAGKPMSAPRLESVLIAPDRRLAVINGQQYLEGERFGDGRVLRISESEVVIRRPDRDERLKLFPEGAKRTERAALKGRK